jgi:cytoskeleton protein RodZ
MARKPKQTEQADLTQQNQTNGDVYAAVADNAMPSNCGAALRDSREKQGLSVNDVATRLRLSVKQIQAIETDNFAALPEATIVRGFIRNYAKLLKMPAEPLLDAYHALVPDKAPLPFSVKPTSHMRVSEYQKPKTGRYIAFGLAALLGLGAWFFYQNFIQKPNPTAPTVGITTPEDGAVSAEGTGEKLPEIALPAAEREAAAPAAAGTEITLPNTENATSTTPTTAGSAAVTSTTSAAPVALPPVAGTTAVEPLPSTTSVNPTSTSSGMTLSETVSADPAAPPVSADGTSALAFDADQETWISVADTNGKIVFDKILFAGGRESIDVKPPVKITVGNARATKLSVNGKPMELAPYSRNNIARVKVDATAISAPD